MQDQSPSINTSNLLPNSTFTPPPVSFRDPSKRSFMPFRAIPGKVREFYGTWQEGPDLVCYRYGGDTIKVRYVKDKAFRWFGDTTKATLFGKDLFAKGSAKAITVTEGEEDTLAAYYMQGSKYPVVSVRSSTTARKDCEREFDYLNSFERIYLCFDADEPGRSAARDAATLFDPNKVYIVELKGDDLKDANDYLVKGKEAEFMKAWWNAKKFIPKNIISGFDSIKEVLSRTDQASLAHYPFKTLDDMAYGIRAGEITLITALEKVGKSSIMYALEAHLLRTTDYNVGIIHLEESEKKTIQGLVNYELKIPCHLPDSGVSVDDQFEAFRNLTRDDNRVYLYSHFGSDDPNNILGTIRYLVTVCHCKFIFLDHITMLATGFENDDTVRRLDYISTRLAMLVNELQFSLFLVSHVNDSGQTRGSRNISKIADLLIHLERDPEAESFDERNTTKLIIRGNRFAAKSGPAGYLVFDPSTYCVSEKTLETTVIADEPF